MNRRGKPGAEWPGWRPLTTWCSCGAGSTPRFSSRRFYLAADFAGDPERWLNVSWLNGRWMVVAVAAAVLFGLKRVAEKATSRRAAAAWSAAENEDGRRRLRPGITSWLRRFSARPGARALTKGALSAILVLGLSLVLASVLSRAAFSVRAQLVPRLPCLLCRPLCEPSGSRELKNEGTVRFSTGEPCFASGIRLKKGRVYRIRAAAVDESEGCWKSGPDGRVSPLLLPFALNRRHPFEPWFKLMGRVGPKGGETVAIGSGPVRYRAKSDGELFLYVNDAVLGVPWSDAWSCFYRDNEGDVEVTVSIVASGGRER